MDAKLISVNGIYNINNTMINKKSTKLPIFWSSKVTEGYKRNVIIGGLHRSKRISMNFSEKVKYTRTIFADTLPIMFCG